MAYQLNVTGVSKSFGAHRVLKNIDMAVPSHAIYALLGVNGSGKSTLMKGLVGIQPFNNGAFAFSSHDGLPGKPTNIGSLIESPKFYPSLSALENLCYLAQLFGVDASNTRDLLDTVGLDPSLTRPMKNYSLGMKQRFGIALALLGKPEFLILDEPTNGLDPNGVVEIRKLIQQLPTTRDVTIMVSSHILSEMQNVATHVGILDQGTIRYSGRIADLLADEKTLLESPAPEVLRSWLLDHNLNFTSEDNGGFSLQSEVDMPSLIAAASAAGVPLQSACVKAPSLEEKFFEMTLGTAHVG